MTVDHDKNKQVLLTLPVSLLDKIETFWHENRLSNRNEAIRELIQRGLRGE